MNDNEAIALMIIAVAVTLIAGAAMFHSYKVKELKLTHECEVIHE